MRTLQSMIISLICCLTCVLQPSTQAADAAERNTGFALATGQIPAASSAVLAMVAADKAKVGAGELRRDRVDLVEDPMFNVGESRSQHAARINRNLFLVVSSILGVFVLCRILLLWQVALSRKRGN